MLLEFSVKNFRSFRDKVTLSMVASPDKEHLETNTFEVTAPSKVRLLKSAAIYGANASGKTNVVKAVSFMRRLVRRSATRDESDAPIAVSPFLLDPGTAAQPSEFEISFITDGQRYVYGFSVDRECVHEEWLTAARTTRARPLFHRTVDGAVRWGNTWQGARSELREATRPNALLLSVAAQLNNPTALPIYRWFGADLRLMNPTPEHGPEMSFTVRQLQTREGFHDRLVQLLAVADLGIERIEAHSTPAKDTPLWAMLSDELKEQLVADEGQGPMVHRVAVERKSVEGNAVRFDLSADESRGTARLLAAAAPWLRALDRGSVLLIDEFESSLHPHITRQLLMMASQAPHNPQIIFTTHDCNLLDSDLLRRDQVWFTEKDRGGATDLYSLWDYKVRKDENYRLGYLQGRYGAIPFVGEFSFGEETEA